MDLFYQSIQYGWLVYTLNVVLFYLIDDAIRRTKHNDLIPW